MIMKKSCWLLIVIGVLSCSRGEQIRVDGRVEDGNRAMIYLDEQGLTEIRPVDSTKLKKDGSFVLKDRIGMPTFYNLHLGNRNIVPLLVRPGEKVTVRTGRTGFSTGYEISGSEESRYLLELNRRMAATRKSLDSLTAVLDINKSAGPAIQEEIRRQYDSLVRAQRRYNIDFILGHMNSLAAIYALYQKIDEHNFLLNTYRDVQLHKITSLALDTLYPESEYVQSLKRDAINLEKEVESRSWQRLIDVLPSALPEIRLPDPGGDTIALSSLSGKVIILSFWASWNEESVNLNRNFKRLYEKYHDRGLEIYQVSFDNELGSWMRAIRFDELPWIHVSELSYPESGVAGIYNITSIPSFFLIDREGQIVGKNLAPNALDRKIAELINQQTQP